MADCNISELACTCPDSDVILHPMNKIKLGRFSYDIWTVMYGWYSWGGNRRTCGWYVVNDRDKSIRPLYDIDLIDIYLLEI